VTYYESTRQCFAWSRFQDPNIKWGPDSFSWASFPRTSDSDGTMTMVPVTHYHAVWLIPDWSIVIPLTLLSAYLLLTKPRVVKPQKTIEPDRA